MGYEFITSPSIRNSPYLFYPFVLNQSLEARGIQLSTEAFCAQKDSMVEYESYTSKLDIQIDLECIMEKCSPEHNIW